jgi:formiminotetrahydrofolate cyclodeaminase
MNTTFETLNRILDPDDTSTGGGSASALSGGMAGALIAMVCKLSVKEETEAQRQFLDTCGEQAGRLSSSLLTGADDDRAAFQNVRNAFKLPKETEEQKAVRSKAVQSAWVNAAIVPLENAGRCADLAALVCDLNGKTNPSAQSDLLCAFFLAKAGCLGCLENVAINLPSIKDGDAAGTIKTQLDAVRSRLDELPDPSLNK